VSFWGTALFVFVCAFLGGILKAAIDDTWHWYKRRKRHPEERCERCGGRNTSWAAPSPLWNEVMRGGSIDGPVQGAEIICMGCFVEDAERRGIAFEWRLMAADVRVSLETTTPSGRIWNDEHWLWDNPIKE
jgi:hypothetical protein